ncbi:MAG: hypothetical protein QOI89_1175 [Solirubrobacteraceae bacterium]|jgi:hypothetical protein|nr:hypothetical protein [Solirubrobacteraceae bacterium]
MASGKSLLAALAGAALLPAPALAASAPSTSHGPSALMRALLTSRELWATVDVCSPADQPYTVGIRGSMPGDGQGHDRMYMSFRLQYLNSVSKRWVDLGGASSSFVAVGTGKSARQGGRSFQLVPGKGPSTMRGVVGFQWRHGTTVLQSITRATSAGHRSVAGADPAGFSAATCPIG